MNDYVSFLIPIKYDWNGKSDNQNNNAQYFYNSITYKIKKKNQQLKKKQNKSNINSLVST